MCPQKKVLTQCPRGAMDLKVACRPKDIGFNFNPTESNFLFSISTVFKDIYTLFHYYDL